MDKDMAQLVDGQITLVNTMTNSVLNRAGVKAKFDVFPSRSSTNLSLVGRQLDTFQASRKWARDRRQVAQPYQTSTISWRTRGKIAGKVGENLAGRPENLELSRKLATIHVDLDLPASVLRRNVAPTRAAPPFTPGAGLPWCVVAEQRMADRRRLAVQLLPATSACSQVGCERLGAAPGRGQKIRWECRGRGVDPDRRGWSRASGQLQGFQAGPQVLTHLPAISPAFATRLSRVCVLVGATWRRSSAHFLDAWNVVGAVAHQREIVDDLLGETSELGLDTGAVQYRVGHGVDEGDLAVNELRHVLVMVEISTDLPAFARDTPASDQRRRLRHHRCESSGQPCASIILLRGSICWRRSPGIG